MVAGINCLAMDVGSSASPKYRKQIEDVCLDVIRSCPYSYTKGEAWHVLAQYASEHSSQATQLIDELVNRAIGIARSRSKNQFHEKWGSARFLCAVEELRGDKLSKFLVYQPPLLQALVASSLPEQAFLEKEVVASFLKRSSPEPGLSLCAIMHQRNYTPASFNVSNSNLPTQVQNTLQELGLLTEIPSGLDPIAEMLYRRYKTPRIKSWKTLLGSEYTHTLGFLKQAEASFKSGPSNWLALQNSFNHAIFIALQNHFSAVGHPGKCMVIDKNGEIVNFGSSLDRNNPFAKECQTIADGFRAVNTRRNSLPSSHPYDKKTGNQSMSLRPKEKKQLLSRLQAAYGKFVLLMP